MKEQVDSERITAQESAVIWQMKAWAIIFVICAHCAGIGADATPISQLCSALLQSLGSLGVPIFFFLSGYVVQYKKLRPWLQGKLLYFVVPWLVCGVAVYLYVHLRKGGMSVASLLQWLAGDGSYLWYLSVQAALWLWSRIVFWGSRKAFWKRKTAAIISVVLSAAALLLEMLDCWEPHLYLNPMRWLWIYALGMLAADMSLVERDTRRRIVPIALLTVLLGMAVANNSVRYWVWYYPLFAIAAIMAARQMLFANEKMKKCMVDLGKCSFSIYLMHMPVAGVITNLCNRLPDSGGILTLGRPVAVLLITYGCIVLLRRIAERMKHGQLLTAMIGLR